jgi:hypothetical protein
VPYSQRDIDHDRHSREGLMVYVADVIETQLRNLDEAKEAKQVEEGCYGRVERQQVEDAYKADLQVNPPAPAAKSVPVSYGPGLPRPPALVYGLAGDRHREAVRDRNREALQRFEQQQRQRR